MADPEPAPPAEDRTSHVDPVASPRRSNGPPSLVDVVEVQSVRSQMPPMTALDGLIEQSQWAKVVELLTPCAAVLPPPHLLLLAIALKESGAEGDDARRADRMSIQALAAMLDVPEQSPTALLLARRMQRRNWRQAPAPKARVQVALVAAAIAIGAFVGWAWDEYSDRRSVRPSAAPVAATDTHPAR
jgi:hypothetical protein